MDAGLATSSAALADIVETEPRPTIAADCGVPKSAPGLPARIDSARERELERRPDFACRRRRPDAALDPSEDALCIDAAIGLRNPVARDTSAVRAQPLPHHRPATAEPRAIDSGGVLVQVAQSARHRRRSLPNQHCREADSSGLAYFNSPR